VVAVSVLIALTGLAGLATSTDSAPQITDAWPPGLGAAPDKSPVLSPDEEMKTFALPPGYRVELVASEPMIQEPVFVDFDTNGRLWVIEMPGYMQDIAATNERQPLGRISVLEDLNGDGQMDRKTIFLDKLVLPRALKVLEHGVLVGEPPNLWLARDTDGDLKADTKDLVTNTFGRLDANVEHNANSLVWALDNWMHTSETDVQLRLKKGAFEVRKTLSRGQWGASQDDAGRIYRNSNESVLHVDLVPTPYFARNPSLLRTRGSYESLRGDKNEVNTVWPVRPTPGVNRGYQTGVLRPDGRLARYTAVSAPTVYRGDRLPAELRGNVFVTDPAANVVSRIVIHDDGTRLVARKAYEHTEFLTSTDERFRPVYLSNAPDGTLYLVDMYHGIIQHRDYITEYLRDQILARNLQAPSGHGRIYRIVHQTRRGRTPQVAQLTSAVLLDVLAHPNGWWRDTAQRVLVERGDASVVGGLKKLAGSAKASTTRLHALWTLDGLDSIDSILVARALADPSRDVRVSAIRLSERWLSEPGHALQDAVLKLAKDPDWAVRRQLAASLGELPREVRETALAGLLERHGDDPVIVDAALSGLGGSEPAVLRLLLKSQSETPQLSAAIAMTAATIVRGGQDGRVQDVLELVAQPTRPDWQRSAVLRGAEVTLLGAAMPGGGTFGASAAGRGAGAAAGAGRRGGPGGTPAFPRPAGAPRNQASMPTLPLSREPAIADVARTESSIGQRARAVLARIMWPGKANAGPAVVALTLEEQQRFAAGREVYQTLCSACHQPDGRGREQLAPSLVGSELTLGPSGITARIVLNGKEGPTGLMPPLGAALSDEQIAAALTYIRREWGHTASPVDPSTVKDVRALSNGRTRPWTAEELALLRSQQF
jgi:mono/diheme cytochrome c family protein